MTSMKYALRDAAWWGRRAWMWANEGDDRSAENCAHVYRNIERSAFNAWHSAGGGMWETRPAIAFRKEWHRGLRGLLQSEAKNRQGRG